MNNVRCLLDHGADPNITIGVEGTSGYTGKNCLHIAVEKGNINVLDVLLSRKDIDLEKKNRDGELPLDNLTERLTNIFSKYVAFGRGEIATYPGDEPPSYEDATKSIQ